MKLTILLTVVCFLQTSATVYSQATKFSFELKNQRIQDVLREIEKNSEFRFFYQREQVDVEQIVNLNITEKTVEEILPELFKGQEVVFDVRQDNLILIKPEKGAIESSTEFYAQQQKTVSGKVTDTDGLPLPGVTVVVKGTTQGTVTNNDGEYSIPNIPEDATLVFSFVGMWTQEVVVGNQTSIDVTMQVDAIGIEEVVAIGYGTRKRETLTGAITHIDNKTFETRPISNAINALQGTLSGVTVTRNSGQPGNEGLSIQVRGLSSLNGGNTPLVLVDGIESSLGTVNPSDIESISVLKDGTASIYGNRASNGVILVNTKSGKKGSPLVSYNFSHGFNFPSYIVEKQTNRQWMEMVNEGFRNDGYHDQYFGDIFFDALGTDQALNFGQSGSGDAITEDSYLVFNNKDNEWVDNLLNTGHRQYHNISLTGGGSNITYRLSLGYLNENGVIDTKYDGYKRYNIRLNNTFNLSNKLALTMQNSVTLGNISESTEMEGAFSRVNLTWNVLPIRRRQDGVYYTFRGRFNPLDLLAQGGEESSKTTNLSSNIKIEYDLTKDLELVAKFGINNLIENNRTSVPTIYAANEWTTETSNLRIVPWTNPNRLTQASATNNYAVMDAYLNYSKNINEENSFSVMGGGSHEQRHYDYYSAESRNFPTNELLSLQLGDLEEARVRSNGYAWTIRSIFGRFNYEFKDKLIADAVIRSDGSSRFTEENRWGTFWGAMMAYRLSEENFIKDLNFIDNLKFRASYGETGNQEGIGYYDYLSLVNVDKPIIFGKTSEFFGIQTENAYFVEAGAVSTDRTWETIANTNFGLDIQIMNSKISMSFDYFIKKNKNMLVMVEKPNVLGIEPPFLNEGEMETKGWEFAMNWNDNIGDFNYYIRGTLFNDKNILTKLEGSKGVRQEGVNNNLVGYSTGTYFGWKFDGFIQNDEELTSYLSEITSGLPGGLQVGDVRYVDVDKNGKLSALGNPQEGDTGDLVELGNIRPQYSFSTTIGADYRGFDFNMVLQGVGKRTLFKQGNFSMPFRYWHFSSLKAFYGDTWSPENPTAKYPRLSTNEGIILYNYRVSEMKKLNAAYVRLKNIQFGYSLPQSLLTKINIDKVRLYISGEDIFEFQSKELRDFGFDPESGTGDFSYPFLRTFAFGTQITF